MGACYVDHIFPAQSAEELKKSFSDLQDNLAYEDGHGPYSGTLATCCGLRITGNSFASETEAGEWVGAHVEKRGFALAAKIPAAPVFTDAEKERMPKIGNETYRLQRELRDLTGADRVALEAIKNAKSARITCSSCKSSLTRSYLTSAICPVCTQDGLRSQTQKTAHERRKARLEKQIEKLEAGLAKIRAAAAKRAGTETYRWYVGGLAGS
jgi:hypothetical protein